MRQRERKAGVLSAITVALVFGGVGSGGASAQAEPFHFDVGIRYVVVSAGGEPTNDQMGIGMVGRYRLNDKWLVGIAIDQMSGDYERPYELFGNTSPEEIDGTVDSTILSALVEREYGADRKLRWFWNCGIGIAWPDVGDVTGPLTGGGGFDITTEAGSEMLLSVNGGLRGNFSRRFGFEVGLRAEQHFADWKLTDRANGATATIDDYTTWGAYAGLRICF